MRQLFLFVGLALASMALFAQSSANQDEDDLLLLIPSIIAKQEPPLPPTPPEWGAFNAVCCSTSSATFTVVQGSMRASSTAPSCPSSGALSPFNVSTPGSKRFTSSLRSRGCGNFTVPAFNFPFENNQRYVFELSLDNGSLVVSIFSQEIESAKSKKTTTGDMSSMKKERVMVIQENVTGFSSAQKPTK